MRPDANRFSSVSRATKAHSKMVIRYQIIIIKAQITFLFTAGVERCYFSFLDRQQKERERKGKRTSSSSSMTSMVGVGARGRSKTGMAGEGQTEMWQIWQIDAGQSTQKRRCKSFLECFMAQAKCCFHQFDKLTSGIV